LAHATGILYSRIKSTVLALTVVVRACMSHVGVNGGDREFRPVCTAWLVTL